MMKLWNAISGWKTKLGALAMIIISIIESDGMTNLVGHSIDVPNTVETVIELWTGVGLLHAGMKLKSDKR